MAKRYTDEFRRDAVRMATTSGLTRPQLSSDLGVGPIGRFVRRIPLRRNNVGTFMFPLFH
mgnify:CR=1 FL=1